MSRVYLLALAALLACVRAYEDGPAAPQASEPEVAAFEGGRATLRCLFHGNPPPKITWSFRAQIIDSNAGRHKQTPDGSLMIDPLYRNDTGVYICMAANSLGVDMQQVNLTVNDPFEGQACLEFSEEYDRAIDCPYGIHNWTQNGCNRWQCKEDPCIRVNCSASEHCFRVKRRHPTSQGDWYSASCFPGPDCELFQKECKRLQHCDLGVEKINGTVGCERCKCKQNPCKKITCAVGKRCLLQKSINPLNDQEPQFSAECNTMVKAGACPNEETSPYNDTCARECVDDADCRGMGKCCRRGCSLLCLAPVALTSINNYFLAFQQNSFSVFAPGKIIGKGANRSIYHFDIHTDTTTKPELKLRKTTTGSFQTSEGSTTSERINDNIDTSTMDPCSGFQFGCCADNETEASGPDGQGCPRNATEFGCVVNVAIENDPKQKSCQAPTIYEFGTAPDNKQDVRMPAGIVGNQEATVIGQFEKPLHVPCEAYGNPPPCVFWYRGHEADEVLYNNTMYEAMNNVLLIRTLSVDALGPYTCRAYNGAGKAASWGIIVRAYKPPELFVESDWWVTPTTAITETPGPLFTESSISNVITESTIESTKSFETSEDSTNEEITTDVIGTTTLDPCSGFQFGCCADNVTEAFGPDGRGCPCNATEYGCCPDGVSPAFGFENESCPVLCNTTLHGCCQDGKTPAHGPEFEGCCLLQPFRCCPDNRKPAEGPHFEGCECQYALHGCCPDNITIAQGLDNQGCGCQYTQHGCCPDRHTAASGPNNEDCACNTYQFGCCADGITIAKGPEQQGCHCRDSTFGYCGDGETPATGPEAAGCDCSSSRHGCCLDGRTEAIGPKFLGCTDAPENKQAPCSMSADLGPCRNFAIMWHYNMTYGGCGPFWYGGCDGNGNRFATMEECKDVCVQPSSKDVCKLPSVKGACDADYQRWHYNTTREQCIPFKYGGCLGNANNFDTRVLCQKQCEPNFIADQCSLPIDQGSCAGNYSRWGFNSEAYRCEQFTWGGCEGNSNRFSSEVACQMHCTGKQQRGSIVTKSETDDGIPWKSRKSIALTQCSQPQEAGHCTGKEAVWSFSESENRCLPFYYSGCGGNDNRFGSRVACEQTCPSAYGTEYDNTYVGIKTTTAARPALPQESDEPEPEPPTPERSEFCFNAIDAGPCNNTQTRYAYDSKLGRCVIFQYGGCGGNRNNFPVELYCAYNCKPIQETSTSNVITESVKETTESNKRSEGSTTNEGTAEVIDTTTLDPCSGFQFCCCTDSETETSRPDGLGSPCNATELCGCPDCVSRDGDETAVVTGQLYQPFHVHCFAKGYTSPVSWFFGFTLLNNDTVYEVTGKALIIRNLVIETLGEYRCDTYNEKGKAMSRGIVVQAYEPAGLYMENKYLVPRSMIVPRTAAQPPTTVETTATTTAATEAIKPMITDPVRMPVGIKGAENATLIGELGHSLQVHCQAYGYPPPCVFWYRGDEKALALYDDAVYEARGSNLLIRSLSMDTLGSYTCRAYNGEGKDVSWDVTVQAYKPSGVFMESVWWATPTSTTTESSGALFTETSISNDNTESITEITEFDKKREGSTTIEVTTDVIGTTALDPCSGFKFGCCTDNETEASGPDGLGCPCNVTVFEGCPDGVSRDSNDICESYVANCSRLRCEYGMQRTRLPDGCEKCSCVPVEIDCEPLKQECNDLECNYGIERTFGSDGCMRCKCKEYPCERKSCASSERCALLQYRNAIDLEPEFIAECRTIMKQGACPVDETTTNEVSCRRECADDADCRGVSKCCRKGCSNICLTPVEQTSPHPLLTTTIAPNEPAPPIALPPQEPEVAVTEGGTAKLRCLFHGNPPPKITWRFGEVTIDGNAGRYMLTSDGALEIFSPYRNDTGVYICVADNGVGVAMQEIHLVVKGPVRMPVGIAGDENAVVTGELDQPLHVRCLAYGYPPPSVYWYRGYGGTMVPYNDAAVYEVSGNVLLIRSLAIKTLGQYTCQANNGPGKPASWVVFVRAYMPDGFLNENEFLVPGNTLAPRPRPQPRTTTETTTTTTTSTTTEVNKPNFTGVLAARLLRSWTAATALVADAATPVPPTIGSRGLSRVFALQPLDATWAQLCSPEI